jgi:hypothetical protein
MGVVIGRKMISWIVIDDSGVCRIFIDSPKGFLAGVEENNNFVHVRKYFFIRVQNTDILFRQSKPLQNFVESNFLFLVNYSFFFALQSFSINGFCSIFQNSYFFKVLRDIHDCSGFEKYLH